MTEVGCSSSSGLGFKASSDACFVSSLGKGSQLCIQKFLYDENTFKSDSTGFSDGVVSDSDSSASAPLSIPPSSISVTSVPFEEGAIGEGSAMSLGLDALGEVGLFGG